MTDVLKIEFLGEEINALQEIVNDYVGMSKYSYAMCLTQIKQGEEIIKTGKLPDGKEVDVKKIAEVMEKFKEDAAKIDVAIGRSLWLLEKLNDLLGIEMPNYDESTEDNNEWGTEEVSDDTTGDEPSTEVSEDA